MSEETITPAPVKKPKTRKVTYFKFVREIGGDEIKGKQAAGIIAAMTSAMVDGKADRKAVLAQLSPENLLTRQKPAQVLGFYVAMFKNSGLLASVVEDVEVPAA